MLKDEEVKALIEYPRTHPSHRDLTVLLMDTGVRPGEIVKGEWKLDEQDGTITLLDTKNGEDRTLPFTAAAMAAAKSIKRGGNNIR